MTNEEANERYDNYCERMRALGKGMVSFSAWLQRVNAGVKFKPNKPGYTMARVSRDNFDAIKKLIGLKSFNKCCAKIIELMENDNLKGEMK